MKLDTKKNAQCVDVHITRGMLSPISERIIDIGLIFLVKFTMDFHM
jgi:hypothetical protein